MYPDAYLETEDSLFLNGFVRLYAGMFWDQSVPVYFFISGYVFFLNITLVKDVYIRKMRNRFKSLFIPYLIWNAATILKILLLALPCFAFLFNHQTTFADMDLSLRAIFMSFWNACEGIIPGKLSDTGEIYPQDGPMWFVRDLIIIVLCTPLVNKMLNGGGQKEQGLPDIARDGMVHMRPFPSRAPKPIAYGLFLLLFGSQHEHTSQRHDACFRQVFKARAARVHNVFHCIRLLHTRQRGRGERLEKAEPMRRTYRGVQHFIAADNKKHLSCKHILGVFVFLCLRLQLAGFIRDKVDNDTLHKASGGSGISFMLPPYNHNNRKHAFSRVLPVAQLLPEAA